MYMYSTLHFPILRTGVHGIAGLTSLYFLLTVLHHRDFFCCFLAFLRNGLSIKASICKRFLISLELSSRVLQYKETPFKSNTSSVGHLQGNFQQPSFRKWSSLLPTPPHDFSLAVAYSISCRAGFSFLFFPLSGSVPYSFKVEKWNHFQPCGVIWHCLSWRNQHMCLSCNRQL